MLQLLCVGWDVGGRPPPPPPPHVPAEMRRFEIKNLQPNHVPYCGTSPVKQAAFRGAAASGDEQVIITHFYIIITSLEFHYYTFLHYFTSINTY